MVQLTIFVVASIMIELIRVARDSEGYSPAVCREKRQVPAYPQCVSHLGESLHSLNHGATAKSIPRASSFAGVAACRS